MFVRPLYSYRIGPSLIGHWHARVSLAVFVGYRASRDGIVDGGGTAVNGAEDVH